jgi:homocitrate synthase NifV
LSILRELKSIFVEITGTAISPNKPVIGDKIFDVESGIHVDGIYKNGANYEPFEPSVVGMERKIIAGKHSGRTAIELKLKEYGIVFPKERIPELLSNVQDMSISLGRSITDEEFIKLADNLSK